jgi:hypothetical protein
VLQGGRRLQGWSRSRRARGDDRHVSQLLEELLDVRFGGGDELPRKGEGDSEEDLRGGEAGIFLRRSTQTQQNPGQVLRPARASQPSAQRILELAVALFHHTIGLGVVGGGKAMLNSQLLAHVGPQGGCKLAPAVGGELARHAEASHPRGNEGVRARGGLNPAGRVVYHREEVSATIACSGEGAEEVHVHVQEPLAWHGDGLDGGGGLLGDLGPLAVLAVPAPGEDIPVHALPDDARRQEAASGANTGMGK